MHTSNRSTIRINRAASIESAHGIAVHTIKEPDSLSAGPAMQREINRLLAEASRTLDATHAERCRQTARELYALLNLWRAIEQRTRTTGGTR
jgi:hypothetical protein